MTNKNIVSPTAARIFAAWEKEGRAERPRTYLGASIIGHECDTYLWLYFRGIILDNFDGRMYRLFDRGKREEAVFCADLRRIGCEVKEFDDHGQQFSVSALGGHFGGHLDGIVRGLDEAPKQWHVVEFKTHSDSSFKKLCKEGVKKAKPTHYAQMTVYMGLTGLEAALYMAVNKDNDDLWVERIKFDKAAFELIMMRAKQIMDTVSPSRCANRPDDFRCKACPCASICWHTADQFVDPSVPETCRTCCHATADTEHDGAFWTCNKGHACTSEGKCDDYLVLPFFVKAETVDGTPDSIVYSFEVDGKTDGMTVGKGGFASSELKHFGPAEKHGIDLVREDGAKVTASNSLAMKYRSDKYEPYFSGTQEELMKWNGNNCASIPLASPCATETYGDEEWYEYPNGWCMCRNVKTGMLTVYGEKPPF